MKQSELSIWLKSLVFLSMVMGGVLMFWLAPRYGQQLAVINPQIAHLFWPCLIFVWLAGIPVYMVLYQGLKIFGNIGRDQSFSMDTVHRLTKVSRLALMEVALYFGATLILLINGLTNIQVYIIIFMILFSSIFIAMCSAALSHLVSKAVELKDENDLTI